jgi:hypothetical protein
MHATDVVHAPHAVLKVERGRLRLVSYFVAALQFRILDIVLPWCATPQLRLVPPFPQYGKRHSSSKPHLG